MRRSSCGYSGSVRAARAGADHAPALLDAAGRRWPEVTDRKLLLLRLAEEGHTALGLVEAQLDAQERRERVNSALRRIPSLIEADRLLSDEAWR